MFYYPALILYILVIPVGLLVFLTKNKKKLNSLNFSLKFGFIYEEYNLNSYFWEILKIGIKLALVYAKCQYMYDFNKQFNVIMLTLMVYLFLMLIFKPYDYDNANSLEILSILCSIFNILFVNGFYYSQNLKYMVPLSIMTFLFNMIFGTITMIHIFRFIRNMINDLIIKAKIIIIQKLKVFAKLINKNYVNSYKSKIYWTFLTKSINDYIRIRRKDSTYTIEQFYQKLASQN